MPNQLNRLSTSPGLLSIGLIVLAILGFTAAAASDEFNDVEKTLGVGGQIQEATLVMRFPRTDIRVTIQGQTVPTSLGLTSWAAWKNMGDSTLVVGQLALLQDEVNPVISELKEGGIYIAALTNHFMWEQPRVMFLSFERGRQGKQPCPPP